ncbi:sensor histidine kinase [Ralstonia soli]|uniref:histidine kinase n=1 Tax=Ralstonia soli TaxID=2953896 RepID=A0ABT1ALE4_9RALS|nr:sensor histidine kinase [Ralstonia soli]MCO5399254.1 ATP-binding protein [Ralstonia soli]
MYALLPAFVSSLFLFSAVYVLSTRGRTRASSAFFYLAVLTALWQGLWAFLFRAGDVPTAQLLAKAGWLAILPLPTTIYHFAVEVTERPGERRWLRLSYALAGVLMVLLVATNWVIAGVRLFDFGFYPKAGPLEAVHITQTVLLILRSLWLLYVEQRHATAEKRKRLQLCIVGVAVYSLAAIDYAVNYGLAPYPPGVLFIACCPPLLAWALVKLDFMRPYAVAAGIAHELRTPLTTIRMQAGEIAHAWPAVFKGYQAAVSNGLVREALSPATAKRIARLPSAIDHEVNTAHTMIDMELASITLDRLDTRQFAAHSLYECVAEAVERYPFQAGERARLTLSAFDPAWRFVGSETLLVYVVFNLIKNALQAIQAASRGMIEISATWSAEHFVIDVRDTGCGIAAEHQGRVFDAFYSTRHDDSGHGMGLTFCRRVMHSFGGRIECQSVEGEGSCFSLYFPRLSET